MAAGDWPGAHGTATCASHGRAFSRIGTSCRRRGIDVIEAVRGEGVGVLLVERNVQRALDVSSRAYLLAEGRVVMGGDAADMANNPELRKSVLGI